MNKPKLDLLGAIQLTQVTKVPAVRTAKAHRTPKDTDLRLFADGSCYPSAALIEEFQLEYQDKDSAIPEFGFDVFETTKWGMWPSSDHFVMIAQTSKHDRKVDLFSKTSYDADGHARSSVASQGAATFGKKLISMLEQTYNEELFKNGNAYVDLDIMRDSPISPTQNGIYNIPKMIVKGEKAGTYSFERRENLTIYPLLIREDSLVVPKESQDPAVDEIAGLAGPEGGDHIDEPPLSLGNPDDSQEATDALAEANDILGTD